MIGSARQALMTGWLLLACLTALLLPAMLNGLPLLFTDSAIHLRSATGNFYAIERSYFYGLAHRPFLVGAEGPALAWRWAFVQAGTMSLLVVMVLRRLDVRLGVGTGALLALALIVSAAPWHISQLLPDAYTPALALLAFLLWHSKTLGAATLMGWLCLLLLVLFHHSHLPLFAGIVVALGTVRWWGRRELRSKLAFFLLAAIVSLSAFHVQRTTNQLMYGEKRYNAVGPLFLAAALEEDGRIGRWLDEHCPNDATNRLCAHRDAWPNDAQELLWGKQSSVRRAVFEASPQERHAVLGQLDLVNRAILRQPGSWLSGARGAAAQLARFAPLDDDCPQCAAPSSALRRVLRIADADVETRFAATPQAHDAFPKAMMHGTVALSLLAALAWLAMRLPAHSRAYRSGDAMLDLVAASVALALGNALVMGMFSRPDDRYQSRVYWLFVLVAAIDVLRRSRPRKTL